MKTVHYNQGDEILEITIRDHSGAKMEVRRCNLLDEKETTKIFKWLKQKYGIKIVFDKNFTDVENEFFKF